MSRPRPPRLAVINGTCLDVVEHHRAAIEARGVELWADQDYRQLDHDAALAIARQVEAVVLPASARSFPHEPHMAAAPGLLTCAIAASGFDWLDVAAATRHGIVVTNSAPPEGVEVVADMAWALMLAVARQVPHHHQAIQAGRGDRGLGTMLWCKTLGIVGLGRIGQATARRARGFDMKVLAATPHPDAAFVREHAVEVVGLEELLGRSDFVSLHVRLTSETRGMIGAAQLGRMKPTAYLVNTARQELVDEGALIDAITTGRLAGAGLDDPPARCEGNPLLSLPNVIFTPHLGNRAIEGVHAVFLRAVENAIDVIEGRMPASVVNPEVYQRGARESPWAKETAR